MRLYAIFLALNIQLTHIFAYPPNPPELANYDQRGYECGNVFFTYKEIKDTLVVAQASIDKEYQFPQRYQGKLYIESGFEEYFQYPVKKGQPFRPYNEVFRTVFRVIFTRNSDIAVGVIAKITNGDFTKCIQLGSANIGPSHLVQEIPNGYLCGHQFFSDETIQQSLALARARNRETAKYPCNYFGLLFPGHIGLLMWPIMKEDILYTHGTEGIGPYFLILSKEEMFVDVVVKGYNKNFLRCIKSRKPPKAPASDLYSNLFVPPPRYGYFCGKKIFHDNVLEESAEILKTQFSEAMKRKLLKEYFGPPFNEPCLIWPLLLGGRLFKGGQKGPYRLILTPQYRVLKVAIYSNGKYKACERNTITANKNHETSSFHCNEKIFTHQQLLRAADQACVRLNALKRYNYPANYDGPGFEKDGPYLIHPLLENGVFAFNTGLHRVVINTSCEIVWALTTLRNDISKRLVRCHRLADGPLPPEFFGANAVFAFES